MRWCRRAWVLVALLAVDPSWAIRLPADARVTAIHPGASMFRIRRTNPAMAIDGFVWRRDERRLDVAVTAGRDQISGLEATSRQIGRLAAPDRRPIAAVNGDFYTMSGGGAGAPVGLFVRDGELLALAYDRPAFVILSDGSPHIGAFRTAIEISAGDGTIRLAPNRLNNDRGPNSLVLYTRSWAPSTKTNDSGVEVVLLNAGKLTPNYRKTLQVAELRDGQGNTPIPPGALVLSGHGTRADALRKLLPGVVVEVVVRTTPDLPVREAVGGSAPVLCQGGKVSYAAKGSEPKHPRTAMGFDADEIVAVTVDGRRPGHSVGMTLPELAAFMGGIGCREAINLDGGGSTTCWVRGTIQNRPSDGRERSVANALALVSKGRLGEAAKIAFEPAGPILLAPGASLKPAVHVTDALLNPLADTVAVEYAVEGAIGHIADGTLRAGATAGTGKLIARSGEVTGSCDITVVDRVPKLVAEPSVLELLPGATASLTVQGADERGREILIDPGAVAWAAEGAAGKLDGTTFTAGGEATGGAIVVRGYGAETRVPVTIGGPVLVEDFETTLGATFDMFPATVTGAVSRIVGDAAAGGAFARLDYQLGEEASTRAAYLKIDRPLGAAMALRARARGDGQRVWLRVAVKDGNGIRETHTLFEGMLGTAWQTLQTDLPAGIKEPVTWESVYVVTLKDGATATKGRIDWDLLEVVRAP